MAQHKERLNALKTALERLQESIISFQEPRIKSNPPLFAQIRDSVIKRFEFCVDLFWKCLKDHLMKAYGIEVASPKTALRECLVQYCISAEKYKLFITNR